VTFSVHPQVLEDFGRSLTRLAGDAKMATDYVATHTKNAGDKDGVLLGALYMFGVARIGAAVQKNLERLDKLSASSARELDKCADVYRRTEQKNAERMDRAYPK
jgi:hypothetical protein